jgi:hypothetical protein
MLSFYLFKMLSSSFLCLKCCLFICLKCFSFFLAFARQPSVVEADPFLAFSTEDIEGMDKEVPVASILSHIKGTVSRDGFGF